MPEYLAPGVYVEEVPSGNKPIEGVSTSTAGMVGVTQRGPVDEPTLVTSFPEFTRQFGGYLDHRDVGVNRDELPYAVEGFFNNGGQRVYISRVIGANATFASVDLFGTPTDDAADTTLAARVGAGDSTLLLSDATNVDAGTVLLLQDGPRSERVTISTAPADAGVSLLGRLHFDHTDDAVAVQTVTDGDDLTGLIGGDMNAGATQLVVNDASGLTAGDVIRISDTASDERTEFVTITTTGAADFNEPGLLFTHPQGSTSMRRVTLADAAGEPGARAVDGDAATGTSVVLLTDASGVDGSVIRIGDGATREVQVVAGVVSSVQTNEPLDEIHSAGTRVTSQVPLLGIFARHQGRWGNDLRIIVRHSSIVETDVAADAAQGDSPIQLGSVVGLTEGSVVEITTAGGAFQQRVQRVSRESNEVEFDGGVRNAVQSGDAVRSMEFTITIDRIENDRVVETETIANLGMDGSHARNAATIVGRFDTASNRPERAGESELIRIAVRPGGGLSIPLDNSDPNAGLSMLYRLSGGRDDIDAVTPQTYIGRSSVNPDERSGIQSLENIDEISIVAVPGQFDQDVQGALIAHCTRMRYRFAVLDAIDRARLRDVQTQRQNYDTTFAALYYPWMMIRDPFGRNGDQLSIPPSGHVAGIYARTDNTRGVHKAPANEAILGIRELQVQLTKGEQDILNPRHINCLRDFRDMNRGLRVWGARTLSSDPEWRYINVRRLFQFVEKSIEKATQYAVFEPNSEALWATISRSVTNFLTAVWRDGALEGTKPEEAFFVKVDRSTMTQSDIDNGRLIILIGIAPVRPAEFVIFRISQKTREATG